MKKIILALAVLAAVVCPVFAGESWIGVTTGPAFELSNSDDLKALNNGNSFVTDFNWDVNVEGAYYFNEAETMGIGAKLGLGFNYGTSMDKDYLKTYFTAATEGLLTNYDKNPMAGLKIAPAVTFQYRLALSEALDFRMGAGVQYVYTMGNTAEATHPITKEKITFMDITSHNIEIIANADIAYSFGSFQVFGGVDLGVSVMCYMTSKNPYGTESKFVTDGFQMSITPRIGVSYAF